jgi:hypothetical protein
MRKGKVAMPPIDGSWLRVEMLDGSGIWKLPECKIQLKEMKRETDLT